MIGTIGKVLEVLFAAIQSAIRAGKTIREATLLGLEQTAEAIRSGKLNIDDAVEEAEENADLLAKKRGKFKH